MLKGNRAKNRGRGTLSWPDWKPACLIKRVPAAAPAGHIHFVGSFVFVYLFV